MLLLLQSALCLAQTEAGVSPIPLVKKSEIKQISLEAGIHDYALEMTNGKKWNLRMLVPVIEKEKKYPLVVGLHWAGDNVSYKTYSDCLLFPAFENINTFIFAPSSDGMQWINPVNEKRLIDLLKKLKKQLPIANEQLVITGYSNGGIGSWTFAQKYPKLFRAAIPMAGTYQKKKIGIPIYAIHGAEDELFKLSEVQYAIEQSKKMGSEIELSIVKGLSHFMACGYTAILREKALLLQATIFEVDISTKKL